MRIVLYIYIYTYLHEPRQLQIMKTIMACSIQQVKWLCKKWLKLFQQFLKNDSETTEPEVWEVCETESTIESMVPSVVVTSSQTMSMKERLNLLIERKEKYCTRRS